MSFLWLFCSKVWLLISKYGLWFLDFFNPSGQNVITQKEDISEQSTQPWAQTVLEGFVKLSCICFEYTLSQEQGFWLGFKTHQIISTLVQSSPQSFYPTAVSTDLLKYTVNLKGDHSETPTWHCSGWCPSGKQEWDSEENVQHYKLLNCPCFCI